MPDGVHTSGCDSQQVRAALGRVLASPEFESSERLRAFLEFVVGEELAGRGKELKEYRIGLDAFHKPERFDPRTDSSVRVTATKLRAKLNQYYLAGGIEDTVIISIPKGSYVPQFKPRLPPVEAPPKRAISHKFLLKAGFVAACMVVPLVYFIRPAQVPPNAGFQVIQVTTAPGVESSPSFSPDGTHLAYSSDQAEEGNADIFVQPIETGTALRLTSHPAPDTHPAWSPDGRSIAFIRDAGYGGAIYLVASTAGVERKLINVNMAALAWTPDGEYIAALHRESQLVPPAQILIHVKSGTSRPLTIPPKGFQDYSAAFSPDGKQAAISRCHDSDICDIYIGDLQPGHTLVEPLRRLTAVREPIHGLAWNSDSSTIVFSSGRYNDYLLKRVPVTFPPVEPERVSGMTASAHYPSIPLRGPAGTNRVAVESVAIDENIWRVGLPSSPAAAVGGPVIASSKSEWSPAIDKYGRRLAFISDRSGLPQLWVSASSGGEAVQLTSFDASTIFPPQWSPDGEEIVFSRVSATENGSNRIVYTVRPDGSNLRRISPPELPGTRPSWSSDGKWIYFSSQASGHHQIYKAPRSGGSAIQVTRFGGYFPLEAHGMLYYITTGDGVWSVNPNGGREQKILPEAIGAAWVPVRDGVLFLPRAAGQRTRGAILNHWNAVTGVVRQVATLPHAGIGEFTVDEVGAAIYYSRADRNVTDIVVLENYR